MGAPGRTPSGSSSRRTVPSGSSAPRMRNSLVNPAMRLRPRFSAPTTSRPELVGRVVGDLRRSCAACRHRAEVDGQLPRGLAGLGERLDVGHPARSACRRRRSPSAPTSGLASSALGRRRAGGRDRSRAGPRTILLARAGPRARQPAIAMSPVTGRWRRHPGDTCQDAASPMARSVRLRPWQKRALERLAGTDAPDFLAVATPGRRQDDVRPVRRGAATWRPTRAPPGGRGADRAPQGPVGRRRGRASACTSSRVVADRRAAAGRHPRRRHHLPAGGVQPRRAAPARRRRVRDPRRDPPRRRRPGVGRRRCAGRSRRRRGGWRCRARRSGRDTRPSRSSATSATRPCPTSSTATPTPWPTAGSCGPSTSPASTGTWSGSRPTAAPTPPPSTTPSTAPGRPSGCAPRSASTASGCRPCCCQANERLTAIRAPAARRRRPGHRHRPGPRPGHRRPAALPLRRAGHAWRCPTTPLSSTRIARFAASADPWIVAVRMVSEGVDIPRLRVGVYATTTTTELFFRQAVGPLRALDPGRAPPEGVPLHPRRRPPAHLGDADRRRAPPQPPQARARRRRAPGRRGRARRAAPRRRPGRPALDVRRAVGRGDGRGRVVGVRRRRGRARPARPARPASRTGGLGATPRSSSALPRAARRAPATASDGRAGNGTATPAQSPAGARRELRERTPSSCRTSCGRPGWATRRSTDSSTASWGCAASTRRRSISSAAAPSRPSAGWPRSELRLARKPSNSWLDCAPTCAGCGPLRHHRPLSAARRKARNIKDFSRTK